MSEPFYTSHATVEKIQGVHRRAHIATSVSFDCGVHGAIKEHYKLHDARDLPLPVDFVVAATGG
jgi:hypothetical protein